MANPSSVKRLSLRTVQRRYRNHSAIRKYAEYCMPPAAVATIILPLT
jgi:hypothetical protein